MITPTPPAATIRQKVIWKYHTNYISDIRMFPEKLSEYIESLRLLREKYKNQISIKIGLECEILD